MATYKKRGGKPRTKVEKEIEDVTESTTAEVFSSLDEGANRTEDWVVKNQKWIFIILGAALVIALGKFAYDNFIVKPKQEQAVDELFYAQENFVLANSVTGKQMKDSIYNLVLNGDRGKFGTLDIIEEYSGTDAANIATYLSGVSYLRMGKYKDALPYLEDFDGAGVFEPIQAGTIGDAFAQVGQDADALDYYTKAYEAAQDGFTKPKYMFKAALMALKLDNPSKAVSLLETIKDEYKDSPEAKNVDVYLGEAQAKTN